MLNCVTLFKPSILWRRSLFASTFKYHHHYHHHPVHRTLSFWATRSNHQQQLKVSFSSSSNDNKNQSQQTGGAELHIRIEDLLRKHFSNANEIVVKDISGGCGYMFEVFIASQQFKGMSKVKQHLMVSNILKEEIKDMHGIRIFTEVPSTAE